MSGDTRIDSVLADCIVSMVRAELLAAGPPTARIVLRGFTDDALVQLVSSLTSGVKQHPAVIVDPTALVDRGRWEEAGATLDSLVKWRNLHTYEGGRVFVDRGTDTTASINGLMVIDDLSLLGPNAENLEGAEMLIWAAWHAVEPRREPPDELVKALHAMLQSLATAEGGAPPARRWTGFVLASCEAFGRLPESGRPGAHRALEGALSELGLLQDEGLLGRPERRRCGDLAENGRISWRHHLKATVEEFSVEALLDKLKPVDASGQALTGVDLTRLKGSIRTFYKSDDIDLGLVSFFELRQLFSAPRSTKQNLGERVRGALQGVGAQAISAFDQLGVEEQLNNKEVEAARVFVPATFGVESELFIDRLPLALQRQLQKLAGDRGSEPEPLLAVLRSLRSESFDNGTEGPVHLIGAAPHNSGGLSLRAFDFLYGLTFRSLGTPEHPFVLDLPDFTRQGPLRVVEETGDDFDPTAESKSAWAALEFRLVHKGEVVATFNWSPDELRLVPLVRMIIEGADEPPHLRISTLEQLDALSRTMDALPFNGVVPEEPIAADWYENRAAQFTTWATEGLSAASIDQYVVEYDNFLTRARKHEKPTIPDAVPPGLAEFVGMDIATTQDADRVVMMATHPLRLRWFGSYLQRLTEALNAVLDGSLWLNPVHEGMFEDRLRSASPLGQPQIVTHGHKVFLSHGEFGFNEEYVKFESSNAHSAVVDGSSVDLMVDTVAQYLAEFPHKVDGLSLLLLDERGDVSLASSLVASLRRKELYGPNEDAPVIHLRIAVPRDSVADVAAALEKYDEPGGTADLPPPLQIYVHEWESAPDSLVVLKLLEDLNDKVDLVLAPDVFGGLPELEKNNDVHEALPGIRKFDPLTDRSTYAESTQALSVLLLPAEPDHVMESWSTLSVWAYSPNPAPSGFECFRLKAQFLAKHQLFTRLHDVGHWVVTLDRFVGRAQISLMQDAPDIINVKDGVGKAQAYTLTVSSTSGRQFIERRLGARVASILGQPSSDAHRIAQGLFELGRNVAPGVMLKALGLGHTTEEIIGLVVARSQVSRFEPVGDDGGLEVWLSMDDYTHWFGGSNRTRPDLARLVFKLLDGRMRIDVCLVEAKYRTTAVAQSAADQARAGIRLFSGMFGAGVPAGKKAEDTDFWIAELIGALRQMPAPGAAANLATVVVHPGAASIRLDMVLQRLTSREYDLGRIDGAVSVVDPSSEESVARPEALVSDVPDEQDVMLYTTGKPVLLQLLAAIGSEWRDSDGAVLDPCS